MKCPKCKSDSLKRKAFGSPAQCDSCHGLWFTDDEYKKFSTALSASEQLGQPNGQDVSENDMVTGLCPAGHSIMIRARVGLEPVFYLEKCTTCNGIWFDAGEWERIVDNNLLPELNSLWSNAWQDKQRKQRSRKEFLALNRELLGEEIYTTIVDLADALKSHPQKDRAIAFLQRETQESD